MAAESTKRRVRAWLQQRALGSHLTGADAHGAFPACSNRQFELLVDSVADLVEDEVVDALQADEPRPPDVGRLPTAEDALPFGAGLEE